MDCSVDRNAGNDIIGKIINNIVDKTCALVKLQVRCPTGASLEIDNCAVTRTRDERNRSREASL
jgi:hypothetical protein